MDEKNKGNQLSYRPSPEVQKLFDEYCSEKALLNKSQLIEIAFKISMMRSKEDLDNLIWRFLTGKFDDGELQERRKKFLAKVGKGSE